MLLDSLIHGLRPIADFDHLDKQKIESVIDREQDQMQDATYLCDQREQLT